MAAFATWMTVTSSTPQRLSDVTESGGGAAAALSPCLVAQDAAHLRPHTTFLGVGHGARATMLEEEDPQGPLHLQGVVCTFLYRAHVGHSRRPVDDAYLGVVVAVITKAIEASRIVDTLRIILVHKLRRQDSRQRWGGIGRTKLLNASLATDNDDAGKTRVR